MQEEAVREQLVQTMKEIVKACRTRPAKGTDWEQQWWTNMNRARTLAEAALRRVEDTQ